MEGFTDDLTKTDVPIGSGLTKVTREDGFTFLLDLHEDPYLKHNKVGGKFLSGKNSCEFFSKNSLVFSKSQENFRL